ncbi:MAG: murein L,D-transpeptidase [Chitinophagaceae bacterium]
MKNFFIYIVFIYSFLLSCSAFEKNKEPKKESEKKISKRDLSITKANAYNDLFLDSADVAKFIAGKNLSDSVSRRMRSFYNARNYQYAWFSSKGLAEQTFGFWNLHNFYTTYSGNTSLTDKALKRKMDRLVTEDTLYVRASDKSIKNTELTLTQHFIEYSLKNYEKGFVKRKELERFIPRKKEDPLYLADSILTKKHKDNKYYEDVNEAYKLLKMELNKYYYIAKSGGWQQIPIGKLSLKKGASSPAIALIKRRLQLTGDMPGTDSSQVFNDTLEFAVRNFQHRHGFKPTGIISSGIIKQMNVPAITRVKEILINMDRMRWMPNKPKGNLILVNIPEFVLHVFENKSTVFDMPVVVGKEGHNTMMFTGNLNQVVFSPYWNVPESIVEKEILPAMAKDSDYLVTQNMEITGTEGELPVIRQLPGPKNSLGNVKFLFPNSFNIYFHDTPAKSLFNQERRAFSHGCIRLSDPFKMAQYVLRDQSQWTPEKILEAMNSGKEKFVKIEDPIPVFITYYTAWVDEIGQLNFRDDIYKHDQKLMQRLF